MKLVSFTSENRNRIGFVLQGDIFAFDELDPHLPTDHQIFERPILAETPDGLQHELGLGTLQERDGTQGLRATEMTEALRGGERNGNFVVEGGLQER